MDEGRYSLPPSGAQLHFLSLVTGSLIHFLIESFIQIRNEQNLFLKLLMQEPWSVEKNAEKEAKIKGFHCRTPKGTENKPAQEECTEGLGVNVEKELQIKRQKN